MKVLALLRNKFFLTSLGFIIWMLFFDRNDIFTQLDRKRNLREIQVSKTFFAEQIAENRNLSNDLKFNVLSIEKYAREQYLMKRDNEDLFIIEPLYQK